MLAFKFQENKRGCAHQVSRSALTTDSPTTCWIRSRGRRSARRSARRKPLPRKTQNASGWFAPQLSCSRNFARDKANIARGKQQAASSKRNTQKSEMATNPSRLSGSLLVVVLK
ncbi:uncharacterized protein LOC113564065 [Drosophila erecta]|uniref:uncharacterized protein LOC113564063 n=1 Tax=Drosophila erecta TaxID=7220 RepID=UPI000F0660FE|nr:uncharacterized protein LOC113564063 [Drosophila erecta]XP_026834316.1 uncharacterized protein LOC113564065 [Drosophila erecta]